MKRDLRTAERVGNVDLQTLGVAPGARVIDVGCGEGGLAELLAQAGLHVTGVEPDERLRRLFSERLRRIDPESEVVYGLADALPFADGELSSVLITEVLEHVPDPLAALTELRRVMRTGGRLCLSVPTSYTELLFWRLHPHYAENATHERIFTRPELRRLISKTGFEIERWEGRNFLPALSWIFHSLLRSRSDHTGAILEHAIVDRALNAVWRLLGLLRLGGVVEAAGNRIWAKSWYVYCRAV